MNSTAAQRLPTRSFHMLCHSHVQHGRRQESHPKEGRVTWKVKERAQDPKAPKKGAGMGGVVFAESLVAPAAPYPLQPMPSRWHWSSACPGGGPVKALPHSGQAERKAETSLSAVEITGSWRPLTEKGLRSPWMTLLERGLLVWAGVGPPGASGRRWLPSRRMH